MLKKGSGPKLDFFRKKKGIFTLGLNAGPGSHRRSVFFRKRAPQDVAKEPGMAEFFKKMPDFGELCFFSRGERNSVAIWRERFELCFFYFCELLLKKNTTFLFFWEKGWGGLCSKNYINK